MKKLFLFCLLCSAIAGCSKDGTSDVKLTNGTKTNQTVYADETTKTDGIKFSAASDWYATISDATRAETGGSAVDWLSLNTYSGTAGEYSLTMTIKPNTSGSDRRAVIRIVCGETTITIMVEQRSTTQNGESLMPPENEIWYTSDVGLPIAPNSAGVDVFGGKILSNTYVGGKGIIVFDAPVTFIGDDAFDDCSHLTSITIPNSVTSIGDGTFSGCSSLTSITIPDGVTSIGGDAFRGCYTLTEILIPGSVTAIGDSAFWGCSSLTSITILEGVTSIGKKAFVDCSSLTSITIPEGVTSLDTWAFYGCSSLTSITIPDSVKYIGDSAFQDCSSLTSITIQGSVTSIDYQAFVDCSSLTSVTISEGVTEIGRNAFMDCSSLKSITIPYSVKYIGYFAFMNCRSLTSVYCKPYTPPTGGYLMFDGNGVGRKIYVPYFVEAYKTAEYWRDYASSIVGYDFN